MINWKIMRESFVETAIIMAGATVIGLACMGVIIGAIALFTYWIAS